MPRPSFSSTPEKLLGRNDSKNPSTTCNGMTTSGRPCRRALAVAQLVANTGLDDEDGVVALVRDGQHLTDAKYYCWQHKDQAQPADSSETTTESKAVKTGPKRDIFELRSKTSINSLMQNLNIQADRSNVSKVTGVYSEKANSTPVKRSRRAPPPSPSIWRSLCCMLAAEDDDTIEIIRHKRRMQQGRTDSAGLEPTHLHSRLPRSALRHDQSKATKDNGPLSYVRPGTSPQTAAALLTELAKPISPCDEEGYIYMFWLTPASQSVPHEADTMALLSSDPGRERRISDVMSEFSVAHGPALPTRPKTRKIMLKIGRANNVTRRMNEWQRQCGYQLSLIRWYPYKSKPSNSGGRSLGRAADSALQPELSLLARPPVSRQGTDQVRKVPCVKRVERLIHLELNEQQVKRQCANCGREHREWFMIDANEQGIRQVDEVIRKWVQWSERQHIA